MTAKRRRFKQTDSLEDRLAQFAANMRQQAHKAPPGGERDSLLKRAADADHAIDMNRKLVQPH